MKILLLADQAEPTLWEHLDKRKLEGVELVLSCGDLPASYLSFLTTDMTSIRRRAASASKIRS